MKPITYLCFTLLSIVIQFCLMDFINGRSENNDTATDDIKNDAGNLAYILKNIKEKPHALFYRTKKKKGEINTMEPQKYNNVSLPISYLSTTTENAYTLFDLLYEENSSTIDDNILTTETYYTSSEVDNVTEITFFDKNNTTTKPTEMPKKRKNKEKCHCDLLYKLCDINCCCDSDCSEKENILFNNCIRPKWRCFGEEKAQCLQSSLLTCNSKATSDIFHYLFCIDKINLPDKIEQSQNQIHSIDTNKFFKWNSDDKDERIYKFNKTTYKSGEPVWLLENGIINTMKFPTTFTNKYCNGQKEVKFLHNDHIKCYIKINDLHMIEILKLTIKSNIVSTTTNANNSTLLNCTTLHCTNWTLLVCDENVCNMYNDTLHLPTCSNNYCNNIATKIEYIIHCNGSLITEAIIKLHVKQVSTAYKFVWQEIFINFYLGNASENGMVKYSGNIGYLKGYPVIASFVENNHTKYFYNRTYIRKSYLSFPINENGHCLYTNITHNVYKFGQNEQIKCRLTLTQKYVTRNKTDGCIKIQEKIIEYLEFSKPIFISPMGNPNDLKDDDWLTLKKFNKTNIYGQYLSKESKFVCHNIITKFTLIVVFADVSEDYTEQYKILTASVEGAVRNVSFSVQSLSTVVTLATRFIDASLPHLSHNFFFPLKSRACNCIPSKFLFLHLIVSVIVLQNK